VHIDPLVMWGLLPTMAQPLRSRQVSVADGLSENANTVLHQDRSGFLWVCTEYGLNKYDGHHVWTWHATDGLGELVPAIVSKAQKDRLVLQGARPDMCTG
jgi:ligand-binding sensor domain-containing protein